MLTCSQLPPDLHVIHGYLSSHNARKAPPCKAKGLPINDDYVANIPKGNTVPDTLTGEYLRHGSKLNGPCTLLLVNRTTTTHAKAASYVLRVYPDGRRSYVSSLWQGPTPGTFALEHGRQRYTLTLQDTTASIGPCAGGTEYSSVPPVAKSATISVNPPTTLDTVL